MDWKQLLKAALILFILGSSLAFSSSVVQRAADTAQQKIKQDSELNITTEQWEEIQALTLLLFFLGASVYLLVQIFSKLVKMRLDVFIQEFSPSHHQWALV